MNKTERILQNRYLIEALIGKGGMGSVYLGIDQRFGTNVAIKETISANDRMSRAFEHEAQLLNSLRHPALPHVVDYFTEGDEQFIVMEYIAGEDLSDILKRQGNFKISEVLKWADDLLDALNYLHTQMSPVVHRDIKPQNLKLTPRGEIILLDFGLAKGNPGELSHITMETSIFGYSRAYASLEQIQGTGTDPRSDLYSLSSTLYHLLTGQPPVDALTRAKSVLNGETDSLQLLNSANPKIPLPVADVLHQALALNANLRPQTAAAMRSALKEAISKSGDFEHSIESDDVSDDTLVPSRNSLQDNIHPKKIWAALAGKNNKSDLPFEPRDKENLSISAGTKKSFHPSISVSIVVAILIVFAGALKLLNTQVLSLQKENSNSFQAEAAPPSRVVAKEDILSIDAAPPLQSEQKTVKTTPTVELAESDKRNIVATPSDTGEKVRIGSQKTRPVTLAQTPIYRKPKKEISVVEEPAKQAKVLSLEKPEAKNDNQKRGGFKGFLNKISSGAMSIPKNIFKKKKD